MDREAEPFELAGEPGQPAVVMGAAGIDMGDVGQSRDAGGLGRRADVERPAHTVQHVGDVRRAIGPAEAKRRQPMNLGERSEEHTSELQSLMRISYAVFCLKKKKKLQEDIAEKTTSQRTIQNSDIN